jgi:hypothetical protein
MVRPASSREHDVRSIVVLAVALMHKVKLQTWRCQGGVSRCGLVILMIISRRDNDIKLVSFLVF